MVDIPNLRSAFAQLSSAKPRCFSAPGRVNLIGEHTDYNDGFVLPMAANLRTYVAAAPRSDGEVHVLTLDLNRRASFSLARAEGDNSGDIRSWLSYVKGITQTLMKRGLEFEGADMVIASDVPIGAGLSSSAALEISVGFALTKLAGFTIDTMELALAAQESEHVFVGTQSGLMDQLTAAFGEKNHAMFIDCRSRHVTQIPMELRGTAVVVCDTGVKHALATSAYNTRRRECENAVALLRARKPGIRALRDVELSDLDLIEELPEPERRRARHVVSENERTRQAACALEANDVVKLGQLMKQSHESLRDDYEVSCSELDLMFDLAQSEDGVAGARMMGGGFGGCTINLVARGVLDRFTDRMTNQYRKATGLVSSVTVVQADDGVGELDC